MQRKETATVNLACRQLSQRALTAVSHGPRWLSGIKLARADSNWLLLALALARAGSPYTQKPLFGGCQIHRRGFEAIRAGGKCSILRCAFVPFAELLCETVGMHSTCRNSCVGAAFTAKLCSN